MSILKNQNSLISKEFAREKEQIKQQLKRNAKLPDQAFKYTQPLEVTQHLQAEVLQELLYLHKNLMQKIGL